MRGETSVGAPAETVSLSLHKHPYMRAGSGRNVYEGSVVNRPGSSVVLAEVNGAIAGSVTFRGGRRFELQIQSNGRYELHRVDSVELMPCAVSEALGAGRGAGRPSESVAAGDDDPQGEPSPPLTLSGGGVPTIDLLVAYTDDARAAAGGTNAIEATILIAIAEGNTAFDRSNIDARLRLVHMAEVAYTETANPNTDVTRLRNTTDGIIDEVHAWRDLYGADVVAMVVETMNGFCGLAFVMDELTPAFAQDAFSVTRRDCMSGYTLIHELGHNLGCDHTRDDPSLKRLFPYSWGYRFTTPSATNRTVMARGDGTRILNYSNPDVTVEGSPTGVPSIETNSAHNAATIEGSKATVAAFRQEKVHIGIQKVTGAVLPQLGEVIIYTLTVTNSGLTEATGVQITDSLPPGLTMSNASPSSGVFSNGLWAIETLEAGAGASLSLVTVIQSGFAGSVLTNTATLSGVDQVDDTLSNNSASAVIQVRYVDIAVTKTVDDDQVELSEFVTFTVAVTNLGADAANGVVIDDNVPAGFLVNSATPDKGTYTNGQWAVGALSAGSAAILTIDAQVEIGTRGFVLTNTASVAGVDEIDGNQANDVDSAVVFVSPVELHVSKSASTATVEPGQTVVYSLAVSNGGPNAATGMIFTDQLPLGFLVTNGVPSVGTYSNAEWRIASLGVGSNASLMVTALVLSNAVGTYATNTLRLQSVDQAVLNADDSSASAVVVVSPVDLALVKTVDDLKPNEGDTVVYALALTNLGFGVATHVEIADVLPSDVSFVNAAGDGIYSNGRWLVETVGALEAVSMDILATVNSGTAGTSVTNAAALASLDQADTNTINDVAAAMFVVEAVDLVLQKSVDYFIRDSGDPVRFTVQLSNQGNDFATGIEVTELMPPEILLTNAAPNTGVYSNGSWFINALGSGGSAVLTLAGVVQSNGLGRLLTNTVHVTSVVQTDVVLSNNSAYAVVAVDAADLHLEKTVAGALPDEGDEVVYTVTVSNRGPNSATTIIVSESLPSQLSLSNATASVGTFTNGTWSISALAAQTTAVLTIRSTVNAGTSGLTVTNTATIDSHDQADTNLQDNADTAILRVKKVDIHISKWAVETSPSEGGVVNFVIQTRNNGPDVASDIQVADPIPSGLMFSSFFGNFGTYSNGTWFMSQLFPYDEVTLTLILVVNPGTVGMTITNVATLLYLNETDPVSSNDQAQAVIYVAPTNVPVLALAGAYGAISPSGLVWVAYGGATSFLVTASSYYHISELTTNASTVGDLGGAAWTNYTWSGIKGSGTVEAVFGENLATNDTPEWWLALHGLTNGFDAEAMADQDVDGAHTWEEHVAGTDPTNEWSVFSVTGVVAIADPGLVLSWYSVSNKVYSVEASSNAGAGYSVIASNIFAIPPVNVYTAQVPGKAASYFRVRVE